MSSAAPIPQSQSPSALLSATLVESRPLTSDVRLLTFEVGDQRRLDFLAGQSVRIELPMNGKLIPLDYSIASPPGEDNRFELCIKAGRRGSPPEHLCNLKEGGQIRFFRPQGSFVLRQPAADTAFLFLAAGTGIAPVRSMLQWLMRRNGQHKVSLLFGARDARSLFFHSEFLALAEKHPHFTYLPVLSRPQPEWRGASGHVHHHLDRFLNGPARAYLCGPPAMIKTATGSLIERGWPSRLIHFDRNGS